MNNLKNNRRKRSKILITATLIVCSVFLMMPLYYIVVTSFKTLQEAISGFTWLPNHSTLDNFKAVFQMEEFRFLTLLGNTLLLIALKSFGTMFTCSLVAYGFVRYQYRYKELLFSILMSVLIIPVELLTIPYYEVYINLGWMDTYLPMTVCKFFATDIFAIFLFRQFFRSVPAALFEAARVDGCSEFRMYSRIMLPLSKPVFVTLFLLYFTGTYNDIYEPNLYLLSEGKYTLAQGIQLLEKMYDTGSRDFIVPWNTVSAATIVAIIPVIVLFFVGQKYFVEGLSTTGIKG